MNRLTYEDKTYEIIGKCFQVHNQLGPGFLEIVYKDALECEFDKVGVPYAREVAYEVHYKNVVLPHKFYADFVVYDKIILEVKGVSSLANEHFAQTINYLKVSGNILGLLVNFGEVRLICKRVTVEDKLESWKKLK